VKRKAAKIKPIDTTWLYKNKRFRGLFVALSQDGKKVLGSGHTFEEVIKQAEEKGEKDPLLERVPWETRSYLL